MKLSASILSANILDLKAVLNLIDVPEIEYIHIDVMDGNFVPNLTFGPKFIEEIKKHTKKPLDVHIMVKNPDHTYKWYIDAGCDILTFHLEASLHPERLLQKIKACGIKAGISVNPATSVCGLKYIYGAFDLVLLMSVNPGFGGQALMPNVLEKLSILNIDKNKHNFSIELDGGVNINNINNLKKHGVDIAVAGNAIFNSKDIVLQIKQLYKEANS